VEHLGSVVSTAAVLVALFASAGYGFQRGRVGNLREQLDDERKETASLKEQRAERDQQINDLKAVVRIATGEVQTQAILDLLEHHHASSERRGERSDDLLEQILDILVRRKT
jgi:hypothetical protein